MTFSEISSLFETAKQTQPWARDMRLSDFAAVGARATGDPEMLRVSQAGSVENTLRGWNQGLTNAVNSTPIDEALGEGSAWLGELFGVDRQAAYDVGRSLPRQALNIAPMLIPGPGWVTAAGMASSAALSAVDTYDQTGSTWQAGISAVAPTVVSKAMSAGGNAVLQAAAKSPTFQRMGVTGATQLAPRLTNIGLRGQDLPGGSMLQDTVIKGLANKTTKFLGGEAAGQATGLGLDVLAQGTDAVFNKDYLFANLVGNLAFAPLNIPDFIGTKVIDSREIVQEKFPEIRNASEQRAFDFDALLRDLTPAEQTQAKKASGLDIAQQYIQEERLRSIEDIYSTQRTTARSNLEQDWAELRTTNPNLPELPSVKKPTDIPLDLYPSARTRYDEYDTLVRKLNQEENLKFQNALMKPNLESLQKVALDDLQLPEKLTTKPVAERTLKDYQDVLADKLSDRGVKVMYAMHKLAAGEEPDLQVRGISEELQKMLRLEPTKFAEDRAFVAAAMWALGKKPTPEKFVMRKVKQAVAEGEKPGKAVAKIVKSDAGKIADALKKFQKKRGADTKKRKVSEEVTQRVENIEKDVFDAAAAVDAKKASEDQKVLADLYNYASTQSDGDEKTLRAMLSSLSKVWTSGESREAKVKKFKSSVVTIKENMRMTKERKEVVGLPDEKSLMTKKVEGDEEEDVVVDEETDGEEVVTEMLDESDEMVTAGEKVEEAKVFSQDKAVEKEMLRMVMQHKDLGPDQAREFLNNMPVDATKALWKMAEGNLMKHARNNNDVNVPQEGLQQVMSFDKWADVLLRDQGFDANETKELKEHFAKVVEMFYSPEVKYGFLDEFPLESKLAKGYVGVVGENGVRWRFGELNAMTHDERPDTTARLGESKFRYRDDNQTLYRWSTITEVEMENIKAKLQKVGKEVKHVKLIYDSKTMAESHGISTLFGPEPGEKVKWAAGLREVSPEELVTIPEDLARAQETVNEKNAKDVDLSEPVGYYMKDGKMHLFDGHHRWLAAKLSGRKMKVRDDTVRFARASAGGGFDFALGEVQGGKLLRPGKGAVTLAKDGTLSVQELKVAGGQFGPLQDGEVAFYKELVPEAFVGERVNVKTLWEKLNTLGEQVKVVTYGQAGVSSKPLEEFNQLTHEWWDNLDANTQEGVKKYLDTGDDRGLPAYFTDEDRSKALRYKKLVDLVVAEPKNADGPKATSYYNQISPFDTKKFPVLRVDVVLPTPTKLSAQEIARFRELNTKSRNPAEQVEYLALSQRDFGSNKMPSWAQDNLHENLPNTLGWAMVQIVPHPVTGEKVMFVGEAQSRWAQEKRKADDYEKRMGAPAPEGQRVSRKEGHPLLPIHQNLILKAVIKEAQKQGISKVAVSDGETAMMTEGHDRTEHPVTRQYENTGEPFKLSAAEYESLKNHTVQNNQLLYKLGDKIVKLSMNFKSEYIAQEIKEIKSNWRPSQEGGMRLAYDTTMPSIMKKLVGEGRMEDFGVHKNARRDPSHEAVGSPVFRTYEGTPKTNITARVYDTTSPSERASLLFARKPIPGSVAYAAAVESKRQIFLSKIALAGLSPLDKIRAQASNVAHELSHIMIYKARNGLFGPEAKTLVDDMELWVNKANPEDVDVFVDTLAEVFLDKKTRDLPGVGDVIKNLRDNRGQMDPDEVLANVYGIWATGLHQVKDPGRFYTMLPRVVRDLFDWVAEKIQGVVRAGQMYVKFGGDKEMLARAGQVRDVFAAVRKGARTAEENLGQLAELANLAPSDLLDLAEAKFAKGKYGGSGKTGAMAENVADNWIMRGGSLAATYEGLKKPFMAMVRTMPLTADLTAQALAGLGWGDYSYTGLAYKKGSAVERINKSAPLHKLASKINVELQKLKETAVIEENGMVRFDTQKLSPEVRGELAAYSLEAQAAVAEYFIKRSKETMPIVHGTIVAKEWEKQTDSVHLVLNDLASFRADAGGYQKAELLAERLMTTLKQGDEVAFAEAMKGVSDPIEAKQTEKFVRGLAVRVKELEEDYKMNPAFGSLKRFQPIKQKWTKGDKVENMQARTAKEAEAKEKDLLERGFTPGRVIVTEYKKGGEWVMESVSKQRLRDKEDMLKAMIEELPVSEEVKSQLLENVDFVQMMEADEAGKNVFSTKVERKFAPGVEDLHVLEQDVLFVSKAISAANKQALASKVRIGLKNPNLDNHLDAKNTFQQMYVNYTSATNDGLRKLSKANAAFFIGFNIPGHIAELMQPVMTHLAEMRNVGLSASASLGVLNGAAMDIFGFYKRNLKKFVKREEVHLWDDWKNPEEAEMLKELKHVINSNPLDYAFDEMGFRQQQLMEASEVGKGKSLAELVASPAVAYGNWGLKFYNMFTRHNTVMGLVGGYRAYRKAGFSHAEAKEKVQLYEVVVNKSGGRADRQASPFKGNALLGHLFYGLQGYTTGWMSQLLTYARHGYKSEDYAGFKDNPQAMKNARNALWTMLGAQLGAAGLMGLPFVSALITLYEEFAEDDVRGDVYEALENVTGDPLLTQAATHGVASAVAEKLGIPADLHGRFAIGGFLGFNAYDGFSASSLLGPTAGMVNSLWNMGSTFAQEKDVRKALDAGGPTGIRSIAKALDEELPMRGESQLGTAFGFKSTEVRKEKEFERIAQKRNEKAARDVAHAAGRVQASLGRGSQYVQELIITEAKKLLGEDQTPLELKGMVSKIASKVRAMEEAKRLPSDLREIGTPQTQAELSGLARAMGVRLPPSQEVEREQLKSGLYQMMGIPYRSNVKRALMQDLATEQEPFAMR